MPAAAGTRVLTSRWTDRVRFPDPAPSAESYRGFNLADHVGDDPAAVRARRTGLQQHLGLEAPIVFMEQVHGTRVTVLDQHPGPLAIPGTDALIALGPGVPLAVLTADCVPVILSEPQHEITSVIHAGRQGVVGGIVGRTVAEFVRLGVDPAAVRAMIGPAIGGCCYEVPAAMQDAVCAVVPQARAQTRWGTPSLDLASAVLAQLRRAGVRSIEVLARCTYESTEYYSYRRDGVTGRFAGVCALSP